jgi:hypothetical protein
MTCRQPTHPRYVFPSLCDHFYATKSLFARRRHLRTNSLQENPAGDGISLVSAYLPQLHALDSPVPDFASSLTNPADEDEHSYVHDMEPSVFEENLAHRRRYMLTRRRYISASDSLRLERERERDRERQAIRQRGLVRSRPIQMPWSPESSPPLGTYWQDSREYQPYGSRIPQRHNSVYDWAPAFLPREDPDIEDDDIGGYPESEDDQESYANRYVMLSLSFASVICIASDMTSR